jgi:hypothetical protein
VTAGAAAFFGALVRGVIAGAPLRTPVPR